MHRRIGRTEITEFVIDGVYFDEPPTIEVADPAGEVVGDEWTVLHIRVDAMRRPIILHMTTGGVLLADEVAEAIEAQKCRGYPENYRPSDPSKWHVNYAFEVDERSRTEDCVDTVDAMETYLARRCEGIVYAPNDGYLNRLVALR